MQRLTITQMRWWQEHRHYVGWEKVSLFSAQTFGEYRWSRPTTADRWSATKTSQTTKTGMVSPSLKESLLSGATWRIFAHSFSGKAVDGLTNAVFVRPRKMRCVDSLLTGFLFEVVEPFFSRAAAPLHMPS